MFRISGGTSRAYCDGVSRRHFLQIGVAGVASASLSTVLRARAEAAAVSGSSKSTSVILLWLDGGPGHMDTYDMKPDAPAEYRGIWRPIKTNVPGMGITELFPLQSKLADKFSLIRSLHHDNGDHFTAAHHILTSRGGPDGNSRMGRNPSIGSIAANVCGSRQPGVPAYVAVPYASSVGLRPGYFGGNYLGTPFNPYETDGDPNAADFKPSNLQPIDALSVDRLEDRNGLRKYLDQMQRNVDVSGSLASMDRFQQQAYELVTSPAARKAFDIASEDANLRDRYGRNSFGQSSLLARRLVEAGSTFVTVHYGGWDHHWDLKTGMENNLPIVDSAVSSLLTDLSDRGLLDTTMVMLCGEFSRTPRMNNGGNGGPALSMGTPGRDHWGNAMSVLIAGGGVQGGRIVGSTDRLGESPKDRPISPGDLHATIYKVLGVDPTAHFLDRSGRPVAAIDGGQVIEELF
ncbi:MAG: DUF1501 domain-containing protein [Pirellulales bacterium]